MKATGIVRRIDDLGRVVIPKEIRRTMRIREGDPLEIFTNNDGDVIFKKYSPMGEMVSIAEDFAAALSKGSSHTLIICDRDRCIAVGNGYKKEFLEKSVTTEIEKICEERKIFINKSNEDIFALDGINKKIYVLSPIITAGDIIGCVALIENENENENENINEQDVKIVEIAAQFLSSRSE